MNEFTKEELKWIYGKMPTYLQDREDPNMFPRVKNKIQFMIDNYCEHEFDMNDWVNDSTGCRWYECKKCQRLYR